MDYSIHDVENIIFNYCQKEGLKAESLTQNQWGAVWQVVGMTLSNPDGVGINTRLVNNTPSGKYELKPEIFTALETYKYICGKYSVIGNIWGFSAFSGLPMSNAKLMNERLRGETNILYKLLSDISHESASNMLTGGTRAPMSVLPYLNHFHGWMRENDIQADITPKKGIDAIPRYGLPDKNTD